MLAEAQHAEFYDLDQTSRGRDYPAESVNLHRIIRARKPDAGSLLDVACGAGEHLRHLRQLFDHVEGMADSPEMVTMARHALPNTKIHLGDLSDFSVPRRFDVITCLNSAIAHLPLSRLRAAVAAMSRHLVPGGVLVIEPFWLPEQSSHRASGGEVVHADMDVTIARVWHGVPRDGAHHLERHVLIADHSGIRHVVDTQVLRHFGRQEYLGALAAAGCGGDYLSAGPSGRSMVIGVRR